MGGCRMSGHNSWSSTRRDGCGGLFVRRSRRHACYLYRDGSSVRMRAIAYSIPGKPVPLGRARVGKHGNLYTPAKSRAYQELVGTHSLQYQGSFPEGPVRLWLRFYGTRKGDLSNYIKSVEDGLTKAGVWGDDAQVEHVEAMWHTEEPERVEVMVEGLP